MKVNYGCMLELLGVFLLIVSVGFLYVVGWNPWSIIGFVLGLIFFCANLDVGR